jgi:hypothetical protein
MTDARFEDAAEGPLRLIARDAEDLQVIAALAQDAVLPASEMRFDRTRRRFAMLLNRYRWEGPQKGERVQAVLAVEDVMEVKRQGPDPRDPDMVLSLLTLAFVPGEDGTGAVEMTFSGDGALRLSVEALEVTLRDVTRPYRAPSGQEPQHEA